MKKIKIIALALVVVCILPVLAACSDTTADSIEIEGELHNSQTIYYVEAARYDAAGNPSVVYVYVAANSGSNAKDIGSRYFNPEISSSYFVNTPYEIRKIIEVVGEYPIEIKEDPLGYEYTYYTFSEYLYYDVDTLKGTMNVNIVEKSRF